MALQIIFGDDEHTAADGAYVRMLKVRKWLYLSASLATMLHLGLYNEDAANAFIQVFEVPTFVLSQAVALGLGYLILQYLFLGFQLAGTYDLVLKERLATQRQEDLLKARARVREAEGAIEALNSRHPYEQDIADLLGPTDPALLAAAQEEALAAQKAQIELLREVPTLRPGYRFFESLIDLLRLSPPMTFAIWTMARVLGFAP